MNNIKYVIFGIFISLILFFFIGGVFSFVNRNQTIHIKDYEGFDKNIEELSDRIDKVKNNDCRSSLQYMLNRIKDNHLTGDIKIKDYYESFYKDNLTFVDYYNYVSSSCNIDNNEIYIKAMSTLVYPTYIKNLYNKSYEIHFKDFYYKDNIDEMGTYSTLVNEMYVLSDLLKEIK